MADASPIGRIECGHGILASVFHHASSLGEFLEPQSLEGWCPSPFRADSHTGGRVALETNVEQLLSAKTLAVVLRERFSCRQFGCRPLPLDYLGACLWACYGRTPASDGMDRRTVPSAGALYPLDVVAVACSVTNLPSGAFFYIAEEHALSPFRSLGLPPDVGSWFRTKHVDYKHAAAVIMLVGSLGRICHKYGERGYRYLLLEAGHAAQNICLAAAALSVPHVPVGGFVDHDLNAAFGRRDDAAVVLYSVVLGAP